MTSLALPLLREELDLFDGPAMVDGQPSWTLHDPVRNLFFRIDWSTFEILQRWSIGNVPGIVSDVNLQTTLQISAEDVVHVVRFFETQQLLVPSGDGAAKSMSEQYDKQKGSVFKWLLHHYLFFRVPLVNPDAWLERWRWLADWFYSRAFFFLTVLGFVTGFVFVFRQWDIFKATLVDTFTFEGLLAYGVAILVVKFLHELGHAFTAKRFGCRVPAMGVAFLVMWPMAYTDTNETWRLTDRYQRLKVASAGILTELAVAVWSTVFWVFLPDGAVRSAFFTLATTSWIATLAINASPFMRFDGYFILSDALDMPNLHSRSFAIARWRLREVLFDLREAPPEVFGAKLQFGLVLFAWATWIYRLVVFLGIAILVYFYFFKVLGVLLFAVELLWFIAWPMRSELREWKDRWPAIKTRKRSRVSLFLAGLILLFLLLPWPGRVSGSAILRPAEIWPVYAPGGARIDSLPFKEGDQVVAGSTLLTMHVPDLEMRRVALQARLVQQNWQAQTSTLNQDLSKNLVVNQKTLSMLEAEWTGLNAEAMQFSPRAPFSGFLRDLEPDLHVGQWVSRKERLGFLVRDDGQWFAETWLDESAAQRIKRGDTAVWVNDHVPGKLIKMKVLAVDEDASRVLPRPELSAQAGGHVLTREKNQQLWAENAIYRITLVPEAMPSELQGRTWRGDLMIHVSWQVPAWPYIKHAVSILIRELSF
jgi:putative peptide zinc metalloprotease protein